MKDRTNALQEPVRPPARAGHHRLEKALESRCCGTRSASSRPARRVRRRDGAGARRARRVADARRGPVAWMHGHRDALRADDVRRPRPGAARGRARCARPTSTRRPASPTRVERSTVAEIYVPFSWFEPMWLENLGFAPTGDGWRFVEDGVTAARRRRCRSTRRAACCRRTRSVPSGMIRFGEAAMQVMGQAGEHQIDGARTAASATPTAAAPSSSRCGSSAPTSPSGARSGACPGRPSGTRGRPCSSARSGGCASRSCRARRRHAGRDANESWDRLRGQVRLAAEELRELRRVERRPVPHLQCRHHLVARLWIGHAIHGGEHDVGMSAQDQLDVQRREVLAVDAYPVTPAAGEVDVAVAVDVAEIARPVPPVAAALGVRLGRSCSTPRTRSTASLPTISPMASSGFVTRPCSSNTATSQVRGCRGSTMTTPRVADGRAPRGRRGSGAMRPAPSLEP